MLVAAALTACGTPFTIEFSDDNTAVIRLAKAKEQTLWIPIDNLVGEVQLTVDGSQEITVPLNVRLAKERVQYWMPLYLTPATEQ